MTAMADAGITGGSSEAGPSSAEEEIHALKLSLQDQRRRTTLLNADLQMQIEAREAIQAQLMEAHTELAASRDRRKEMARVINNREAKIADLNVQLQARYEELAAMQRRVVRSSLIGGAKWIFQRLGKIARKTFGSA
jgi:chromosome segregation ATPase